MPLTPGDRKTFYEKISLQGWKGGESLTVKFLNNGRDYTGPDYGLTYIYDVELGGAPRALWVKPGGPLAIGLVQLLTKDKPELEGRKVKILKETGEKRSDTRYTCTEV
jgi:hypothetical protein